VPGHPTPQGVFSILEKRIYHESNLYSSAPMPYMQRITWSGVAMHQGVVPDINLVSALGCAIEWDDANACFRPAVDAWGGTSIPGIYVAGDGAGIGGAHAASIRGRLAALAIANAQARIGGDERDRLARPLSRDHAQAFFADLAFAHRAGGHAKSEERVRATTESLGQTYDSAVNLTGALDIVESTLALLRTVRLKPDATDNTNANSGSVRLQPDREQQPDR